MPPVDQLLAFVVVAFALIVVPGPSVLFVISRALTLGHRAALATVAGNALGVYGQVVLVAAGLGTLVARSIVAFTAIKLLGAAYLVWLGVVSIRHRHRAFDVALAATSNARSGAADAIPAADTTPARGPRRSPFVDGVVVGFANPKAIVFFAAILPQFVTPSGAPVPLQMLVLGLIFVGIALLSDGAWGLFAATARSWLARSPRRLARLGGVSGLVMIGLGVRLAVTGRHD